MESSDPPKVTMPSSRWNRVSFSSVLLDRIDSLTFVRFVCVPVFFLKRLIHPT